MCLHGLCIKKITSGGIRFVELKSNTKQVANVT